MASTFDVIYLGTFADLDPTEGNTTSEDAALLVGSTFGSAGSPLSNNIRTLVPVGSPGASYATDNISPDQYSIDGTTYTQDAFAEYTALVTFADGTTAEVPVNIFQTTTGELFLAPNTTGEEDIQALMESQPITSLEILTLDSNTGEMGTDRLASNYADSTVEGTAGNDDMRLGYTDADGTAITSGDDTINGGDGNDYIEGAGGADSITGGAGSDAIFGDMGDGSSRGSLNLNVTDNLADSGSTETLATRAVELVTLADGTLIMITSERTSASHDGIATWEVDNDTTSATYGQIIGGSLDNVQEPTMPNAGAGYDAIEDLAAITLSNGETYVFSADKDQDAIGISKIELDGTLTPQTSLIDNVNLDEVQELSIVEVGGQPMLLALSGGASDALVAYTINSDGTLTQTDVEVDGSGTGENYLNNGAGTDASLLESFTDSSGNTFVIAGGADDGISLWTLDGSGQLTFQNARGDNQAGAGETDPQGNDLGRDVVSPGDTGLFWAETATFAEIDGQVYAFVGGQDDDAVIFRVDLDAVNGDGSFDLTLVGHVDDIVSNISTMTVLETDDGPVLVIGGEQASLEFHSITVDGTTGEVTLSLVDTVADGSDGATELADSESIAVEDGILVSASDNDDGVTILSTGLNPEVQTAGADTIDAGAGDDLVMGGGGDDNISGGTGNDTIYGDGTMDRNSLNWENYTTQQVQDGFTDQIGGIDVTFSSPVETGATLAINNSSTQYTGGIDDDGTGVDPNSAFGATLANTSSQGEYGWDFSEPVTNVSFNINDLDAGEQIQILAYDANGNPIEVILTPGSNVSVSDTNADGIDDLASGSGSGGTADAAQSVTVTIPGPVSSIEAIHTLTSGGGIGITFTEMFFDVPVESAESGNDTIDGGDGDDLIYGGQGDDNITGGLGADTIFADAETVSVNGSEELTNASFDGNLSGWTVVNPTGGGAPNYDAGLDAVQINGGDEAAGGDGIEQSFATTDGGVYDVTVDLGQNGSGSGTHTVLVEVLDSGGTVVAFETVTIGQGGSDTVNLSFTASDSSHTLSITNPTSTGTVGTDVLITGASVVQTAEAAAPGNDTVDGGDGDDLIVGGGGDDNISGGTGNDTIYGDFHPIDPLILLNFEDGASSTAADESGNSHDGIYQNGAVAGGTGWNGTGSGVTLDGSNDYVEIADSPDFDLTEGTIAVRFNADSLGSDNTLISRDSSGFDGGGHFAVHVRSDGSLYVRIQDTTSTYQITTAAGLVTTGQYYHVAVSFGADGLTLYLDGAEVGSNAYTGGISGNDEPFVLGASQQGSGDGVADNLQLFFDGTMDEFVVYDQQLGSSEIADLDAFGASIANVGTSGNDTIDGGDGDDLIYGGAGNDDILGGVNNDTLYGGDGNDTIDGGVGSDLIYGGAGDDILSGGGNFANNDTVFGGDGNDTIDGGTGASNDLLVGGDGNDSISGGGGADEIYGDAGEAFVFNTQAGDLFIYDPVSGTSSQLTSGLLVHGDIATTPDGTLYGVVLDANDGSTDAAIYEIDPLTGTDTLVYDLPDGFEWFNGLGADEDGNLYYTDTENLTVTRIEPDGSGGFTNPTIVHTYTGEMTDIAFLQDGTVWTLMDTNEVLTFDLDGSGNFTNQTNLGTISGAGNLTGLVQGPDGQVYVTDINGAVYSTDPTVLPLSWTTEASTGQSNVYGVAAIPSGVGSSGDDIIDGGTGNDTISAGQGSDTILLSDNFGDDTIFGGEDPDGLDVDTIDASGITTGGVTVTVTDESGSVVQGADSADFSEIESFTLTDQDDTFTAFGNSDVTVDGGAGDDAIQEGNGNNTLSGGDGNDTFEVGYGTSTIDGGAGTDTLSAAASDDPISVTFDGTGSGTYDDLSDSDSGAFTSIEAVQGSSGDDIINAAADAGGVDLSGGAGDDTIIGGSGNDTIDGGAGADTLTGGSGADVFVAGGDADIITDFDTTTGIDGGTSDDNDFVDLTSYYNQPNLDAWNLANPGQTYANPLGWLRADQADNGVMDQAGGLLVQDSGAAVAANELNAENTGVVCFASGTLIETPSGLIPIERLKVGDIVNSRDNGPQQIVWAGRRELTSDTLLRFPELKPIWLSARFFGLEEDLVVSPQHGVLLRLPERGGTEQLFRATHLADLQGGGARRMRGCKHVTYHHLMFETHQIIRANGFWSESLYPGKMALSSLDAACLKEIFMIFPELQTRVVEDAYGLPSAHYSKRSDLPGCLRELR